jgi:hypothetical protein
MLVRVLAVAALVAFLWSLFRFAMGLRAAKSAREDERRAQEATGRRVLAELPLDEGVILFLEDRAGFYWSGVEVRKRRLSGARLFLNDAVMAAVSRDDAPLPAVPPPNPDSYDGSERWSVRLHLDDGTLADVPCGRLREGVSREAARQVFEAARAACAAPHEHAS